MPRNIIDYAQEYYRSPPDHEEMAGQSGPTPLEISNMLDILSGDASSDGSTSLTEDARKAVFFTLEKVIFLSGGSYYHVLGLAPDAAIDQIRKHYDQLQRIFFREDNLDKWNNDYALRINQAYRTLRDPEKRRIYDESLPRHSIPMPRHATGESHKSDHKNFNSGSFIANSVHRAYSSHVGEQTTSTDHNVLDVAEKSQEQINDEFPTGIPKHDLYDDSRKPILAFLKSRLSIALLAGVIIMVSLYAVMLPPAVRDIQTASSEDIPDDTLAGLPATEPGRVVRHLPPDDEPIPLLLDVPPASTDPEVTVADELPMAELPVDATASDAATAMSPATTRPAEPEPERQVTAVPSPVSPTSSGPALPPAPVINLTPARLVATTQELNALTSTFASAYKTGDLDLMLGLFTDDARTNERSGKAEIRLDYRELFDATESREFIIKGMRWQQGRDGGVSGEGSFEVNIRFRDDGSENSLTGDIVLHVEKRPQGARITRLLHSYH